MKLSEISKNQFVKRLTDPLEADFQARLAKLQFSAGDDWTIKSKRLKDRSYFIIKAMPSQELIFQLDKNYADHEQRLFRLIDLVNEIFPRTEYKHGGATTSIEHLLVFKIYEPEAQ